MSKAHPPELRKFMDKKLSIKVNGGKSKMMIHLYDSFLWLTISGRKVEGMLRGFDPFMNLVIDDAIEYRKECFKLRHLVVKL